MFDKFRLLVLCPLCGYENTLVVDRAGGSEIFYCDSEAGGCDELIAAKWRLTIEPTVRVSPLHWISNDAVGLSLNKRGEQG